MVTVEHFGAGLHYILATREEKAGVKEQGSDQDLSGPAMASTSIQTYQHREHEGEILAHRTGN